MDIKSPDTKISISSASTVFGFLIAGIIFAVILVILKQPTKYSYYIFSLTLTGLFFFIIFRYRDGFDMTIVKSFRLVDCVMIIFASIILFSNFLGTFSLEVTFGAALIVLFFVPGWALLRALGLDRVLRGNIELFVLSFSFSVIISALILISGIIFHLDSVAFNKFVTLVFFAISIIPFITRWPTRQKESEPNIKVRYNYSELFCLAWLSILFIFVIWNLYPKMAGVPGYDINDHYAAMKQVLGAPDIFFGQYPWFHFQLALLDQISLHPSVWLMQSGLAMMSIVSIFSFYIMARSYLASIDIRAPLIATILFAAFAGFGWIHFLQQAGTISDLDQEWDAIRRSWEASYYDIGSGVGGWIWMWFRPITVAFTILFVLLYLLNTKQLSRPLYLGITSALIVAVLQIHAPELVIFALLIWVTAIFFPSLKLRTKEAAISILIGLACSSILSYGYGYIFSPRYVSTALEIYVPVIAVLAGTSLIFLRKTRRIKKFVGFKINWNVVIVILAAAYIILLFFWISISDNFHLDSVIGVHSIYGVPWEFYPLLLGIVGLLAIPGIIIILRNSRSSPIIIFVLLFFLTIVLGRTITFLNANVYYTDYWERRLTPILQASASIVASIVILQIVRWLERRNQRSSYARRLKNLLPIPLLSIFILAGSLSTFLTIEYQIININFSTLTELEKAEGVVGISDPYTTILTVSDRSRGIAQFSSADYIPFHIRYQLWPSQSPEFPLKFLYGLNNTAVVYLRPYDISLITRMDAGDKYIASHLLNMSIPFNNITSFVGTNQLPKMVPVASKSDAVLVVPEKLDRQFYYAYDILSGSGYNYTSAVQSDINSIRKARIIIAPSETIGNELIRHKSDYNLQYEYLIILNLEGSGKISNLAPSDSSLTSDLPSDREWIPMNIGITSSNLAYMLQGHSDTIYYFNLYPLIQNIESNNNVSANNSASGYYKMVYYKLLSKIMGPLNLPFKSYEFNNKDPYSLANDRVAAFEQIGFSGGLSIKSTSAIVRPSNTDMITVRINGHDSKLENVSEIIPLNSSSVTISANKGMMSGGAPSGFYSRVSLDQSVISFGGEPVRLMLKNSFGNQTSEITASNVEVLPSKADVLIRLPQVDSNGRIDIYKFAGQAELFREIGGGGLGPNLVVTGKTTFQVEYSDKFTLVNDLVIDGKINRPEPLYAYDELGSLINLSSEYFVVFPIVGVVVYLLSRYKIIPNRENTWFKI
jgi:hypothetical protein